MLCISDHLLFAAVTRGWMNVAYFSCSVEVLSCVRMQLVHLSLVCLVFVTGFVSTEGTALVLNVINNYIHIFFSVLNLE